MTIVVRIIEEILNFTWGWICLSKPISWDSITLCLKYRMLIFFKTYNLEMAFNIMLKKQSSKPLQMYIVEHRLYSKSYNLQRLL